MDQVNILQNISLFSGMAQADLDQIATKLKLETFSAQTRICNELATEDTFYIIIEGQVQVTVLSPNGQDKLLKILKAGDHFGEMALITGSPRSASVTTITSCQLGILYKQDFDKLFSAKPELWKSISQALANRLYDTNRKFASETKTKLVAWFMDPADRKIIEEVAEAVREKKSSVKIVNIPSNPDEQFINSLLQDQGDDYLILPLPANPGVEYEKIIRICHKFISIGCRPEIGKNIFTLASVNGTHIIDSIVRKILGKSVGLALSSGTAQGLTHLGVLKVLEREGIPIDMIASTSGGSLYGAPFAFGVPRLDHESALKAIFEKGLKPLRDWAFSFKGLFKGEKLIKKALIDLIGQADFAQAKIPLLVVASDITNSEEVVFWEGNVAQAVRASISIAVFFTPLWKQGKVLVDGAYTSPVPVDALYKFGCDRVIAVHVSEITKITNDNLKAHDIFMRSRNVAIDRIADINCTQADLVIMPEAGHIGMFEYEKIEELVTIGEQATEKMLPVIRALTKG